jgi:Glu-tRNA(Gln) amidotransferase subunit E-like FAD-binding protein
MARKPPVLPPAEVDPNPPHGERADFIKVTITVSPYAYQLVVDEVSRRKKAKLPDAQTSAIIRELIVAGLGGVGSSKRR